MILNLKHRVIHISNEFEDFTGYSLSDFREPGINLIFAQSAAEELIQAMSKEVDFEVLEVPNLALTTKDGKRLCWILFASTNRVFFYSIHFVFSNALFCNRTSVDKLK